MHLQDKISSLPYISEYYSKKLNKLNIFTVKDLLTYFPRKYEDSTEILTIQQVLLDDTKLDTKIQLKVFFEDIKNIRLKSQKSIQKGIAYDKSGKLECIWFNQPYLLNFINPETEYMIIGKFTKNKSKFVLYPTTIEALKPEKDLVHTARITPKYSLTSGISEKWFRNRMKFLVENISSVEMPRDFEAIEITQEYIKKALKNIHFPENYDALEESINLLSLIELIQIQLKLENNRAKFKKHKAIEINPKSFMEQEKLINELPFKLTKDQMEAIQNLNSQMMQKDIINALIQGDVGSGKTIVSIAISIPVILSGYQVIFLAPTTILAEQQYKNFQTFLKNFNLSINLVTGKTKKQQQADILIGTTAVLARKQNLINKPGLVIVDEQHRFGVNQREDLLSPFTSILNKKEFPHFINMSATPIPRTIAQTMFGDVSVIEIKSKPTNRKPIKTFITPQNKLMDLLNWLNKEIKQNKAQAYWVCPLVEESEKLNASSSKEIYSFLSKKLKDINVGLIHGKMKEKEKQEVMNNFKDGKVDILVATSVIEVGIDVPNATIMVIQNAERFGLAQLHQIRGRVGRGDKQSYCFLFTADNLNPKQLSRIEFFAKNSDGMKIAQFDLENRGPGEIYGTLQTGIPNLKIAQLNNLETIKKSKKIAKMLYNQGIKEINLF